ncbi:DUF1062 domain-containing protein [Clostridium merdae]|uniref:DUF1062 domain-containing protein n=1 Tax=Clostridium merdae TaxID=1958780 RepID=UPI000A266D58|nr:DUF1062 domain-containing protein [Clostridium merdae]
MTCLKAKKYEIIPTEPYKIIRNCSGCGRKNSFFTTGKIRINANGKQLDIWLIYQCEKCRHTYNLPIYSRINRNELSQLEYETLIQNNEETANKCGYCRDLLTKNHAVILEEPSYLFKEIGNSIKENTIEFLNPYKIKTRYDKLVSKCFGIPRYLVKKWLDAGTLTVISHSDVQLVFAYG